MSAHRSRYIRESIDSILAQRFDDFELLVIDDVSPDGLDSIVAEYDDARVSYRQVEKDLGNHDLVGKWNKSIEFAKGDYVILATDDDLYEPTFLSSFAPLIEKYPDVDLFRARILTIDANGTITSIDKCYKEYLSSVEFRYHMMHGMRGGIPQYVFKRKTLVDKGGFVNFPKAWASDDATALMMSDRGVVTSQEHLVRFRYSGVNISSDRSQGLEKFKARILFSAWLKDHSISSKCEDEGWNLFYKRTVIDYLPIYCKVTLIATMNSMTWGHWLRGVSILRLSDLFSLKDKCSIVLRSFQKRI